MMSDNKGAKRGWGLRGGEGDLAQLTERVRRLEEDLAESRQLNKRIAELADVVAEVLLPVDQRDDATIREQLAKYAPTLARQLMAAGPAERWTRKRILRHPFEAMNELLASMNELEDDVQELRQLHKRVAELTDVVSILLLPAAQRDDEKVRAAIASYEATLK